ncbi:MAG: hypothetical protein R2824_02360 [Saprospiraceae bacterium]
MDATTSINPRSFEELQLPAEQLDKIKGGDDDGIIIIDDIILGG